MPNINKVVFGNQTLIDLSTTTLSNASQLENGITAYDRAGNVITGTASGGGSSTPYVLVTGEQDAGGGKILHITGAVNQTISADAGGGDVDALSATVLLDISDLTVTAPHLEQGYTAVDSMGRPVVGSLIVSGDAPALDSKTITENGTYNATDDDLDGYSSVIVNVPTGGTPDLQTKTVSITPSETAQTQTVTPDTGKDGLSSVDVSVGAISSSYVGSGIDRRSSSDLTASGATVSVPAGYYAEAASKAVASGSASTPATSITANPSISVSSSGLITASVSGSQSVTPSVSAGYVSSGTAGTVSVSGSNTQQLSTQAAATITPTKSSQTAVAAGVYTTGDVTVAAIPAQYITTTDATASAADIVSGETAYVNGSKVTGSLVIQHYYTGSSAPAASVGSDGDIYLLTS